MTPIVISSNVNFPSLLTRWLPTFEAFVYKPTLMLELTILVRPPSSPGDVKMFHGMGLDRASRSATAKS